MSAARTAQPTWHEANRRYLLAALAVVREALDRHAQRLGGEGGDRLQPPSDEVRAELEDAEADLPAPAALETISRIFGLSPFERNVLLLCAGMELDPTFAARCATAQGEARRTHPTFSLALAALPEAHWSALTPRGPLRGWRLIEVWLGDTLLSSALRVDEHVLHFLVGTPYLDERLQALARPLPPPGELPPSHAALAQRIAQLWTHVGTTPPPVILLCGSEYANKRAIAAAACAALGAQVYALAAGDVPGTAAERESLARLWEREAALSGCVLLLDADEAEGTEATRAAAAFVERGTGMVLVASRDPLHLLRRAAVRLDVLPSLAREQRVLWQQALGPAACALDGTIDALVAQFNLDAEGIHMASRQALNGVAANGANDEDVGEAEARVLGDRLWDACREQARPRLEDLAQRIEPAAQWDDLVLPEAQRQTLRDIVLHVRRRTLVYETWGFAAKGFRGLGISVLFTGASGTGKTMAAEVLANELRLDLYCLDLSSVVSKYIGETEKNLRRVFDAAEAGGGMLQIDEADCLLSTRSQVRDSHDRYANIEVSYLLQRMEAFRGLAILTTNMKSALDTAFLRRIRFVVQFPFPDLAQRTEIWRRIFPPDTPTQGLDAAKLARLNVAGGNIRNIALNAAFLAADAGEPVAMTHLLRAARAEHAKLERPLTEAEIGGWR